MKDLFAKSLGRKESRLHVVSESTATHKKSFPLHEESFVLDYQDSNLEKQDQNLLCYHYTIVQSSAKIRCHRHPFRWATRIRTWKNRTRICCVTITPYPNFPIKTPVLILMLQRYGFLFNPQIFEAFFSNQDSFFLHLPSFPAFLILLDRVSSF